MGIREVQIEISGMSHTVQVNDDDKNAAPLGEKLEQRAAKKTSEKARTPRNKAAKPAANKAASTVEEASDPGASE